MSMSRRQVSLIGGLGVLGDGGAMLPRGLVEAKSASPFSSREMPLPSHNGRLPLDYENGPKDVVHGGDVTCRSRTTT